MATQGELDIGNAGGPAAQFFINKNKAEVSFTYQSPHSKWDPVGKSKSSTVSVHIDDVIAVKQLASSAARPGFELHYIQKQPDHIWKHECVVFCTSDPEAASAWFERIEEVHRLAVSARAARGARRPQKLLVYVNPKSGACKGLQIWRKQAQPLFTLAGVDLETIITERPKQITGHLYEYDLEKSGIDGIVVVGGDGTVTEATMGLINRQLKEDGIDPNDTNVTLKPLSVPIGVIPAGSGQGHVTRTTGTKDVTTSVLNIIYGHQFSLDAFTVHDDDRFVMAGTLLFGFGWNSHSMEVSESNRWMGRGRYAYGFVKAIRQMYTFLGEVEITSITRNEDGSIDSSKSPEIKTISGPFLDVSMFPFDMSLGGKSESGVMHVVIGHGGIKRKTFVKYMGKLVKQQPDLYEFDAIERYEASSFTVKVDKDQSVNSSGGNAGNNVKAPANINIDGEVCPASGSAIRIRLNKDIVPAYGQLHSFKTVIKQ